jgi:hypothetical protein
MILPAKPTQRVPAAVRQSKPVTTALSAHILPNSGTSTSQYPAPDRHCRAPAPSSNRRLLITIFGASGCRFSDVWYTALLTRQRHVTQTSPRGQGSGRHENDQHRNHSSHPVGSQSEHHLCPGQGLRRRQPVREGAVVRPDRTGRWRGDEHHRRARQQAGQARPDDWRHRHRHADGVHIVSALFDRARTGKGQRLQVAMQDSVMHYSRGMFITQARTGAAASRRPPSNNPPGGLYPCKPGGPTITSTC